MTGQIYECPRELLYFVSEWVQLVYASCWTATRDRMKGNIVRTTLSLSHVRIRVFFKRLSESVSTHISNAQELDRDIRHIDRSRDRGIKARGSELPLLIA